MPCVVGEQKPFPDMSDGGDIVTEELMEFSTCATVIIESEFRLYGCLVEHCEKAGISYPQRITATALRKYMATVTQALDLKPHQIDWVMRHMGHSLDVHKIYYRSTSDIIERTQIAKILLLQDTGRLDEFANQSLEDIQLSDSMGSNFSMTKDDMLNNIKKIRTKYETDKEKFRKFEDLMKDEIEKKEDKKDSSGTTGGLWLKRGLEYLCEVFYGIVNTHVKSRQSGDCSGDSKAIKKSCQDAYEITLKAYHNFVVKGVVKAALMMSPTKETLFNNLTKGNKGKDEELVTELTVYERSMRQYVVALGQLFNKYGYDDKGIEKSRDPTK